MVAKTSRRSAAAAAAVAAVLWCGVLAGCGGDGETSATSPVGDIGVVINWPTTRLIPSAAQSIKIELLIDGAVSQMATVNRPESSARFNSLSPGSAALRSTAHPGLNAGGEAQATAQVAVEVVAGDYREYTLTMASTIATFTITPDPASVAVGGTVLLTATAKSASGAVILVPDQATWSVTSGTNVVSLSASREASIYTQTATGVAAGQATVQASFDEAPGSTRTATATVQVEGGPTAGLASSSWPKFRGNARNTGRIGSGGRATGVKLWEVATDGFGNDNYNVDSSPAIGADGTVYFGSKDRKVYAVNGATGARQWDFMTDGEVESSPVIGPDGTVYVGSTSRRLYALDGATGTKKWDFLTASWIYGSPAVGADGTVYFQASDAKVYALDGTTGAKKWEFATGTGDKVYSTPAIGADGTVYVGSEDNNLYALDGATGAKKWAFTTGSRVYACPAVGADGTVYVGSYDNKVYALNGLTGSKKWEFNAQFAVFASAAIGADGTIYVAQTQGRVFALDPVTGAKQWETTLAGVRSSPAVGADGTVYVGADNGSLYALAGTNGAVLWQFATGGGVRSSPAIASDGTIYVGSSAGKLFAIR